MEIEKVPNKTFEVEAKVKFVPVIVTTVPACPDVGDIESTDRVVRLIFSEEKVKFSFNMFEKILFVINKSVNIENTLKVVKIFIMRDL